MKASKLFNFRSSLIVVAASVLSLTTPFASAVTDTYNTAGIFNWVCPAGITAIQVECWGGGGAGGLGKGTATSAQQNGGGGGGGAYARKTAVPVTPGATYTFTIPAAAVSGSGAQTADSQFVSGGDVTFTGNSSVQIKAAGGTGGKNAVVTTNTPIGRPGGAGGTTAASIGDVGGLFAGGLGGTGTTGTSGASGSGGGGGGSTAAGGAGSAASGGTSSSTPLPTPGGTGGSTGGGTGGSGYGAGAVAGNTRVGDPGVSPGGGGGGAHNVGNTTKLGGTGGLGQVLITYDGPPIVKADNSDDLNLTTSWVGGVVPGSTVRAKWDGTVTVANTTVLGADVTWAGIQIANPAGLVTINAGNTLTLGVAALDIDMSAATQDLTLNCGLAMGAANTWDVASGRTLTLSGVVSGSASLIKQGTGKAILSGANTYTGSTTISAGTFVAAGGSASTGLVTVGSAVGNAVLDVPTGGTQTGTTSITVGALSGSCGAVNLTGGTLTTTADSDSSAFGAADGGYGAFTMSTGSTFTQPRFMFGGIGTTTTGGAVGVGLITGGTVNSNNWFILSRNAASTGILTVTGGTINHTGAANNLVLGLSGTGRAELNVTGGLIDNTGKTLNMGGSGSFHWTGTALLNLNGGTVLTDSVVYDANAASVTANSYFNFCGGTLKASAATTILPAFVSAGTGINQVFVNGAFGTFAGGATIDTNGLNSTISANLLAPTGNGVTSLALDAQGSGYIGAPAVKILDNGLPSTATAYAVVDTDSSSPSFGKVTSVVITNPGVIVGTPTVSLVGGGGSGAAVSVATTGPNSSGGLTKINSGTLTLSGVNTYTGTTTISGGTLTLAEGSIAASSNVVNDAALVYNLTTNARSYGNVISGTGTLTKSGTNTLTLSGANTYTGSTLVSGGTLALSGSGAVDSSSDITISGSGAKLLQTSSAAVTPTVTLTQGTLTGSGTVNTVNVGDATGGIVSNNNGVAGAVLTVGALTFNGAATVNTYSNSASAPIITTSLATNIAGLVTVNPSAASWTTGSIYDLISFTGGVGGAGAGQFVLGTGAGLAPRQTATLGASSTAITLTIGGTAENPFWVGDTNGMWNTTTLNNWKQPTLGSTTFLPSDIVLFDDNATGTTTIDIDVANVAPTSTTFNNSTLSYVLGSTGGFGISAGSLTKSGTGTLTISTANTYAGATAINAGSLTLTGSVTGTAITVSGSAVLSESSAGVIGGASSLTHSSTGTSTLAGVNTYTGATTINAGTLTLSGTGTLGTGAALTLGGGQLDLGTLSEAVGAVSVTAPAASGNTISNGSLTGTSYAASNTTGNAIISVNLLANGAAGFTKTGAGTATFAGINTYTGATSITAGTLKLGGAGTPWAASSNVSVSSGALLDLNGTNQSIIFAAGTGLGTVANNSGSGTSTLTIAGTATINGSLVTIADNTTTPGGKVAVVITANTQPMSNANTYSGGTTVNGGAFLYLNSLSPLGAGTGPINLVAPGTGATGNTGSGLVVDNVTYANDITGAGYIHSNSATSNNVTFTGNLTNTGPYIWRGGAVASNSFTFAGNGTTSVLSGVIGSATSQVNGAVATGNIIKSGTGTLTLSGTNVYSGSTTLSGGILRATNASALGAGTLSLGGGTLQLANDIGLAFGRNTTVTANSTIKSDTMTAVAGVTHTLGTLSIGNFQLDVAPGSIATGSTAAVTFGNTTLTGNATVNVAANSTLNLNGTVTGAFSLTVAGTGNVVFGSATIGALANSGGLVINSGGTAAITNNNMITGTIPLTVNGTLTNGGGEIFGVLNGSGTINQNVGSLYSNSSTNGSFSGAITGAGGYNKQGTSTQTLTGINTYVGASAVTGGTLALVGGSQASAITVTGASLGFTLGSPTTSTSSVTFGAGSTVAITGTPTSASYTLMTATSFLGITPVLAAPITGYELKVDGGNTLKLMKQGYASWASLNGAGTNLNDDHDGDGVANGIEYFLGGPAGNTTGFTALPGVVNTGGILSITWPKGAGYAGVYGTDFVVETSATMTGTWTPETIGGGNVTFPPTDQVKYTFPGPLSGAKFARLRVTGP